VDAPTTTGAPTERETVEAVLADPTLIRPVFQPIVDLRRSAVQGYEMLARLANDPSGTPPRWLAAAERFGMSNALEASLVAAGITAREHLPRGTYLSINVSPGALVSSEVRAVLDAAPGGLEQLVLELTEQNGVEDYDGLATALDGVRAAGGHVAVEDAGAGYESLQHVLRLRPEYIKLDRGLISDAHADPAKLAIIEAVGLFAGRLGAELVAPGIERRAEQEMLAGLAVPLGQGYLFGRPGPSLVRDVPIAPSAVTSARCSTGPSRPRSTPACSPSGPSRPPRPAARSSSCSIATLAPSACSCPRAEAGRIASVR
jgi:EAL domain-containing protein (putative c-di-GMP-specific phosphodiesterase class I)